MLWAFGRNGNFSSGSNASIPWLPVNNNYLTNNVQRQQEVILRLQQLTSFRRNNFASESGARTGEGGAGVSGIRTGNYLFHYIHDGEIVLERYFERMTELGSQQAMTMRLMDAEKRFTRRSSRSLRHRGHMLTRSLVTPTTRQRSERSSLLSDPRSEVELFLVRRRFVLFANLATKARVKDLRDKFHLGSIKVTSIQKRMRDFLYFRSLKLDPGEAIIAQVEWDPIFQHLLPSPCLLTRASIPCHNLFRTGISSSGIEQRTKAQDERVIADLSRSWWNVLFKTRFPSRLRFRSREKRERRKHFAERHAITECNSNCSSRCSSLHFDPRLVTDWRQRLSLILETDYWSLFPVFLSSLCFLSLLLPTRSNILSLQLPFLI